MASKEQKIEINPLRSALVAYINKFRITPAELQTHLSQLNAEKTNFQALKRAAWRKGELLEIKIHSIQSASPHRFYASEMPMSSYKFEDLHELLIDNPYNARQVIYLPQKGIICCVTIDGRRYRAEVTKVLSNEMCKVYLFDVGRMHMVSWDELKVLDKEFLKIPPLIRPCQMSGYPNRFKLNESNGLMTMELFKRIDELGGKCFIYLNGVCNERYYVRVYARFNDFDAFYCINDLLMDRENQFWQIINERDVHETSIATEVVAAEEVWKECSSNAEIVQNQRSELSNDVVDPEKVLQNNESFGENSRKKVNRWEMNKVVEGDGSDSNNTVNESFGATFCINHSPNEPINDENDRAPVNISKSSNEPSDATNVPKPAINLRLLRNEPPTKSKFSTRSLVNVIHIESFEAIFVASKKTYPDYQKLHAKIQFDMADRLNTDVLETLNWQQKNYCFAFTKLNDSSPYEMPMWYRGVITAIADYSYTVFLRDIGMTVTITDDAHLAEIDETTAKVKNAVRKCRLDCIGQPEPEHRSRILEKFKLSLNDFEAFAVSIHGESFSDLDAMPVILWGQMQHSINALQEITTKWVNINRLIADNNWATLTKPMIDYVIDKHAMGAGDGENDEADIPVGISEMQLSASSEYQNETDGDNEENGYTVTTCIKHVDNWLPADLMKKTIYLGIPTYVSSDCIIHAMDSHRNKIAGRISEILSKRFQNNGSAVVCDHWTVNQPCFARYFSDDQFYRAVIRNVNLAKRTCTVRFIDYGNAQKCHFKDLRPADMFGDIPILTTKYCLDNTYPISKDGYWPRNVIDFCLKYLANKLCSISATKSNYSIDGVMSCSIRAIDNDTDLKALLISMGVAQRKQVTAIMGYGDAGAEINKGSGNGGKNNKNIKKRKKNKH